MYIYVCVYLYIYIYISFYLSISPIDSVSLKNLIRGLLELQGLSYPWLVDVLSAVSCGM